MKVSDPSAFNGLSCTDFPITTIEKADACDTFASVK